jgi:DNA polymerase-3 subunit beta
MKFSISREALLTPLQIISGVVERKQTMPVLSNILVVANEQGVALTGTNMEVELLCRISDVQVVENGEITIPAKKLSDICRSLTDSHDIEFKVEGDRVHLRAGKSHFVLSSLPAEHFPNTENEKNDYSLMVPQQELKKMLDATAFAMAQQDVRYYLNGMLFEISHKHLRTVATDGHRLALATFVTQTGVTEDNPKQIIIPRKGVLELSRLLNDDKDVELVFSDSHLRSTIGSYTFTSKIIEGKFPDYNRVIPRGGDKFVIADRQDLKAVFMRAGILSHENIRGIRLNLSENQLEVSANNPEHEQAEDYIEVDYSGDTLQIGFNVGYLIDVMNAIDDEKVKLTLSNPNSSALVEAVNDDTAIYVVMPMRL